MNSFCQQFGKRNPTTSAVRSKCYKSQNGQRLVLEFSFSAEAVQIAGWQKGQLIDVSTIDDLLIFTPYSKGRALHGQPQSVKFSFVRADTRQMQKAFGFDVTAPNFWDVYSVNGDRLVLKFSDMNVPDPS